MSYSNFLYSFFTYLIQLSALFFLNWCLHSFMPVMVEALMKGMSTWDAVSVLYCWHIQIAFLVVSFSLREQLSKKAIYWLVGMSYELQRMLTILAVIGIVWVWCNALKLFTSAIVTISFLGVGQILLLIIQFGCLLGLAMPIVNRNIYWMFIKGKSNYSYLRLK